MLYVELETLVLPGIIPFSAYWSILLLSVIDNVIQRVILYWYRYGVRVLVLISTYHCCLWKPQHENYQNAILFDLRTIKRDRE